MLVLSNDDDESNEINDISFVYKDEQQILQNNYIQVHIWANILRRNENVPLEKLLHLTQVFL